MSTNERLESLRKILGSVEDHIISLPDEEVNAIYQELGLNADEEFQNLQNSMKTAWASYKLATLKAHCVAYNTAAHKITSSIIPKDPNDQRKLLDKVVKRDSTQGAALLLKYRDGNNKPLSDKDLKSSLEDLEELGALKD